MISVANDMRMGIDKGVNILSQQIDRFLLTKMIQKNLKYQYINLSTDYMNNRLVDLY